MDSNYSQKSVRSFCPDRILKFRILHFVGRNDDFLRGGPPSNLIRKFSIPGGGETPGCVSPDSTEDR